MNRSSPFSHRNLVQSVCIWQNRTDVHYCAQLPLSECDSSPLDWLVTGYEPPTRHGITMREWGRMPTEDEKLKVRTAGVKDSGKPRLRRSTSAIDRRCGRVSSLPVLDERPKCVPYITWFKLSRTFRVCNNSSLRESLGSGFLVVHVFCRNRLLPSFSKLQVQSSL